MAKSKIKLNAWAIIAALSFLYLAFAPYLSSLILNLFQDQPIHIMLVNFVKSIFNLGNTVNFLACLAVTICVFTKIDAIGVTVACGLFWLTNLIALIKTISILAKYGLFLQFLGSTFTEVLELAVYFVMFAVGVWFTILFFMKKSAPVFAKIVAFLPAVILLILFVIRFFGNTGNVITSLTNGSNFLYSFAMNSISTFNTFALLLGFIAIAFKLANFKKKPKSTAEISEDVVVENVVAE